MLASMASCGAFSSVSSTRAWPNASTLAFRASMMPSEKANSRSPGPSWTVYSAYSSSMMPMGYPAASSTRGRLAAGEVHQVGVAGGDVAQLVGLQVEHAVDEREELGRRAVEGEALVEPLGDAGGRLHVELAVAVADCQSSDDGSGRGERKWLTVTDSSAAATPWPLTSRT